jgi:isopentenyl diphosphate isomerase/L-lactate dehydrogenase-like FMN-dependent dehydrogenase
MESDEALAGTIDAIHRELSVTMFLTGSARIAELRNAPVYLSGRTRQMIDKDNPVRIRRPS